MVFGAPDGERNASRMPATKRSGIGTGQQSDSLARAEYKRISSAEHSREEQADAQPEAGSSGDEDAGQFQRSMGGNEAEEIEEHVRAGAGGADDAHEQAVVEEQVDGSEGPENSARKGCKAHADVVRQDRPTMPAASRLAGNASTARAGRWTAEYSAGALAARTAAGSRPRGFRVRLPRGR